MRLTYKNPRELATCIKDLVDSYLEGLIEHDPFEEKLIKLINANKDRIYKDDVMSVKISSVLGNSRIDIINKIINK
ncbi:MULTISPECIES: TIGR04540 family protein [unclassified Clostridium]|uniref:TIGR04540 family protein n=1 Tax=unclassified Clostridium TaxID=2614128 RepID=UPI00052DB5A4|nr:MULTISPECIES: TIGR04540 family protein [unclassified Clostridium]KGK90787.1 ribonuclease P [Clostridium sp. HMP27]